MLLLIATVFGLFGSVAVADSYGGVDDGDRITTRAHRLHPASPSQWHALRFGGKNQNSGDGSSNKYAKSPLHVSQDRWLSFADIAVPVRFRTPDRVLLSKRFLSLSILLI